MDEMSFYFQATLTRVWAPVGQTPIVHVTPQRDQTFFYGALELRSGREIAVTASEQNSEMTINFLCFLSLCFPTQPILLLLDRAPWHTSAEIQEFLNENERISWLYYPPACPELNPQEHVWSQARDAVSHNHDYRYFQPLIDDFEQYLNEMPFDTNFMQKYVPEILCNF